MQFIELEIPGAWLIEMEPHCDDRGFFARIWCQEEFRQHGLSTALAQCSISFNRKRGTVRGMHYQDAPHEEAKLVRCTQGVIYDVILDLRLDSTTRGSWRAVELSAQNHRMVYIPQGCAHGFQTLTDATEVMYQISTAYHPESARGVRWNDPAFGIRWPIDEIVISDRDRQFPLWPNHQAPATTTLRRAS